MGSKGSKPAAAAPAAGAGADAAPPEAGARRSSGAKAAQDAPKSPTKGAWESMAPASAQPPPPKPAATPVGLPVSDEPDEEVEILDAGKSAKKDRLRDESDLIVVPEPVAQYSAANSQEAPQVPESPETVPIPQAEVPKGQRTEAQRLAEQRLIFEEEKRKSQPKNLYLRGAAPGGIDDLEEEILRDVYATGAPAGPSAAAARAAPQPTALARPVLGGMTDHRVQAFTSPRDGAKRLSGASANEDGYEELMDMILDELQDVSVN